MQNWDHKLNLLLSKGRTLAHTILTLFSHPSVIWIGTLQCPWAKNIFFLLKILNRENWNHNLLVSESLFGTWHFYTSFCYLNRNSLQVCMLFSIGLACKSEKIANFENSELKKVAVRACSFFWPSEYTLSVILIHLVKDLIRELHFLEVVEQQQQIILKT